MTTRTFETVVEIGEDRKLVLQLPDDVAPGRYRVVAGFELTEFYPTETKAPWNFPILADAQWPSDMPLTREAMCHQPESVCTWLAGGGVKAGLTYSETDEFGFRPVAGKTHLHDSHATLLHLLRLDHERLTFPHHGRDYRLTDMFGEVVPEIRA